MLLIVNALKAKYDQFDQYEYEYEYDDDDEKKSPRDSMCGLLY